MLSLIVTLALIGLAVWAITTIVPMPPQIARAIVVVAVVVCVILVAEAFGIVPHRVRLR